MLTPSAIVLEPETGNILIPPHLQEDPQLLKDEVLSTTMLLERIASVNSTLASALIADDTSLLSHLINKGQEQQEAICSSSQAPQEEEDADISKNRSIVNVCNQMIHAVQTFPELANRSSQNVPLPYIKCWINGKSCLASLDSGCTQSLVTPREADRLGLSSFVDPRCVGALPGIGGVGHFKGKVHLCELALSDELVVPTSFFVVDNSLHDVILGMDLLFRLNGCVDINNQQFTIMYEGGDHSVPLLLINCFERERTEAECRALPDKETIRVSLK